MMEEASAGSMRIKIYAPAWIDHTRLDRDGTLQVEEGATLTKVCEILKIPRLLRLDIFCSVNYDQVKMDTLLKDGDIVTFIAPISGG
jgi:molybdopterin converting factor small subunit